MAPAITVTCARTGDVPDILAMIRALAGFHGDSATITLEGVQAQFCGTAAPAIAFVARVGGKAVGYAGLAPFPRLADGTRTIDLQHLYVTETHRNRGVGRALIATARDHARELGFAGMTIGTHAENLTAQAAYRAMGLEHLTAAGPRYRVPLD
jgi:GNAT superfamily N-acetyltransferase